MNAVIHILQTQSGGIMEALGQHISISLISLFIAALIAIPLAIILMTHKKTAEVILQITSILQTIPSLALLGILIPFVGIGTIPSVIALVIYAVMPIFQNTYSGLTTIDPNLEEAAEAFGLSRTKKLLKFQIPLAMPMIISGIRIAMVMIIGTATLAALIGAGGLGTYILLGIETNNNALLLIGAVLSAILTLIFSFLIKIISRLSLKKIGILVTTMIVLFGGYAGYRSIARPDVNITIAGKMGGEPEILINMYKDLIEQDHPNMKVSLKPNFGGTSFLYKALQTGSVDIYPEFTGTVLQTLVKNKQQIGHDPEKTYLLAQKLLKEQAQMTYLQPMEYQNGYDLAVKKSFAKKYNLKTISDLVKIEGQLHAGFDPDFYQQPAGFPGVKKSYNLDIASVKTMEPSIRYKAIANDKVNLVDGYTTDPEIKEYNLVVLKDDKNYFPPYQGAPLMTEKFATKYPEIKKTLNKLSGKISATDMQKMNYLVTVKHEKASKVAHEYLVSHNLLK
ncbi:ABC transporter permease/substrate-binding protein [Companilactobacillus kimchiensis]|uniref:ABC-type proline glycine betaine transport system, permease and substrate binding protein n=1 Tax=Companilactobacillus kimchiensis TaxID=993692 RepID=A0A0R2LJ89_9LACO|nr:ABC transporter permease/substrate-binding protein [Companilactobacillus kimchiensis]KRN99322.1 ABC-type proline glycine betaine transport system, permease and substrate binding protein [Companilactobacillus kimchiensis]